MYLQVKYGSWCRFRDDVSDVVVGGVVVGWVKNAEYAPVECGWW